MFRFDALARTSFIARSSSETGSEGSGGSGLAQVALFRVDNLRRAGPSSTPCLSVSDLFRRSWPRSARTQSLSMNSDSDFWLSYFENHLC